MCWNTSTFIVKVEAFFRNTVTLKGAFTLVMMPAKMEGEEALKSWARPEAQAQGNVGYFAKCVYLVYLNDLHQPKA